MERCWCCNDHIISSFNIIKLGTSNASITGCLLVGLDIFFQLYNYMWNYNAKFVDCDISGRSNKSEKAIELLNEKIVNKDVVLIRAFDEDKNYSETAVLTIKTGEPIHEITKY